jgi:hypothetical protein
MRMNSGSRAPEHPAREAREHGDIVAARGVVGEALDQRGPLDLALDDRGVERLLVGEVAVERGLRDPDARGDLARGRAAEAARGEAAHPLAHDLLAALVRTGAAGATGGERLGGGLAGHGCVFGDSAHQLSKYLLSFPTSWIRLGKNPFAPAR